jgi:5'-nucleotidase
MLLFCTAVYIALVIPAILILWAALNAARDSDQIDEEQKGMMKKQILVTNDDGVNSPGLLALVQEMRKLAQVRVLAPDRNWSGGGHVKTLDRALRVKEVRLADGTQAFASDGAPSDCVALATLGYFKEPIDLVVSGINTGANLGHDVTYSGTVTAAMEAVIAGIPGVAVSLETVDGHLGEIDFGPAARAASRIVRQVLENGLAHDVLLNVNVPFLPEEQIRGIVLTRQGLRVYHSRLDERVDPRNKSYYWIGGDAPTGVPERGTDVGALAEGFVSITPLQLDLTAYRVLTDLNTWHWDDSAFETSMLGVSDELSLFRSD